jgi:hypothetical protein
MPASVIIWILKPSDFSIFKQMRFSACLEHGC